MRRWVTIALAGFVVIILIAGAFYFGVIGGNSALAKRSPGQIMLSSIDIPGTWVPAEMPERLAYQDASFMFAFHAFWFNDTKGSEAGIFIALWGYSDISHAEHVYQGWSESNSSTSRTMSIGDNATVWTMENQSWASYYGNIVWNHSYEFFVLKMNYICTISVCYQDTSGLDPLWAMQVAQEQVNRVQ